MKQLFQCKLQRTERGVTREQTAWIEARGAKRGATVELLPSREKWRVAEVFKEQGMPEDSLREHQRLNRNSLPSVDPMGKP